MRYVTRAAGQQIPCFTCNRCQLTITWMANIKDVRCKPRLHDLVLLEYGRHVVRRRFLR